MLNSMLEQLLALKKQNPKPAVSARRGPAWDVPAADLIAVVSGRGQVSSTPPPQRPVVLKRKLSDDLGEAANPPKRMRTVALRLLVLADALPGLWCLAFSRESRAAARGGSEGGEGGEGDAGGFRAALGDQAGN